MNELEKRLHNLELVFIEYIAITGELLPIAYQDDLAALMRDYFEHNEKMESFKTEDDFL